jgi:hypothetical protein
MNKSIDVRGKLAGAELVAVSSTFYMDPNDIRFELALENAERWRDKNLPYVVIDGSPIDEAGAWVADAHKKRGAYVVRSEINGIATQRKQGVAYAVANGAEKIVGHEPEKVLMSEFSHEIASSLDEHAITVIGRTATALTTLPTIQRRTEHLAGWMLEQTHHLPPDSLSGARGFNLAGAQILADYPADKPGLNNWIYLYDTPLAARKAGLSIGSLMVDLLHPHAMTMQEEGSAVFDRKRYDQFKLQLDYLLSRNDIDQSPHSKAIASITLTAMERLNENSTNQDFETQFDNLETQLAAYNYPYTLS